MSYILIVGFDEGAMENNLILRLWKVMDAFQGHNAERLRGFS